MTQADRIRQFALDHFVVPARAKGLPEITIRAGDIHQAMGLANSMPAVCSAIGSKKFEELARTALVKTIGPANGANVYFHFSLIAALGDDHHPPLQQPASAPKSAITIDFANAIVLVSCVKSKLAHRAHARSLYTSAWFRKVRSLVEGRGARWFILSSRYGLVAPDAEIAPYDYTLNTVGIAERRAWARDVLDKLLPQIADERRIVMFAGHRYREFLIEPLRCRGISVEVPMAHLARGEQLAWLSERE